MDRRMAPAAPLSSGAADSLPGDEIMLASRKLPDGLAETDFNVPTARCGACMASIEGALGKLDGVVSARLNLSTKRVTVRWRRDQKTPPFLDALAAAGHAGTLSSAPLETDPELRRLVRATAVAGFAMMNIMALSASVWSGADEGLRQLFHISSALLTLPVLLYSARTFFESAWNALRAGRTNMDVPISVGILLTFALSAYDTLQRQPHAYFDAVSSLVFFLLVGRTLDHLMRRKARMAVLALTRMMPRGATVETPEGGRTYARLEDIGPGSLVVLAPGDRAPLDGVVVSGEADIDAAIVSGESQPVRAGPGTALLSGMLNLNGSLRVRVTRTAQESFISSMASMMEAAEHGRARYRRLADRAAALYSPVVHTLAAAAFAGWMAITGDWHYSLTIAVAVLIITCPCALGLAVPMVHVMAARRLFERGIALKDGSALERLVEADTVAFDKTGTLTLGQPVVTACTVGAGDLDAAIALARRSRHPVSQAIAGLRSGAGPEVEAFVERPGLGVEGRIGGDLYRLGRASWAGESDAAMGRSSGTVLTRNGRTVGRFALSDALRPQARAAIAAIAEAGLSAEILSGDGEAGVAPVAQAVGVAAYRHSLKPDDKVRRLEELDRQGRKVLMVGDGLNDAPALSAAHVSMAPASAADIGRAAADLVFFNKDLDAVPEALAIARRSAQLVRQNLALSVLYNVVMIPVAVAGFVTPLVAAVAMSASSIIVVANSLRIAPAPSTRTVPRNRKAPSPTPVEALP